MNRTRLVCLVFALGVFGSSAAANTVVFTTPFSFTLSGSNNSKTNIFSSGALTTGDTMTPFDPELGRLNSFTIAWTMSYSGSGTTGSEGGGFSISQSGEYYVNNIDYDGDGNGDGNGEGPDFFISAGFSMNKSTTFIPADAGDTYDLGILEAVLGTSAFSLSQSGAFWIDPEGMANWTASANGNVRLTYDYVAPEPGAGLLIAAGLAALGGLHLRRQRTL